MDAQKQQSLQQSPWKKPKNISMSKSKSLKRKSELFNASLNNSGANGSFRFETASQGIDENAVADDSTSYDSPRSTKIAKTHLNRFSIMNSMSNSLNNSATAGGDDSPAVTLIFY